jgi:hypothetical protein
MLELKHALDAKGDGLLEMPTGAHYAYKMGAI